jgi:hypothetical protein
MFHEPHMAGKQIFRRNGTLQHATDNHKPWPAHMAPPHLRQGNLVDDEKLLMRALRCIAGMSAGRNMQEFAHLYDEIAAAYLKKVDELRASSTDDN